MLHTIHWSTFIHCMGMLTGLYYAVILLTYYRWEISYFFTSR